MADVFLQAVARGTCCAGPGEAQAFHAPLRQMCHHMVKAQADEIQAMRDWLCKWYGSCSLETEAQGPLAATGPGLVHRLQQSRERAGR